MNSKWIIQDLDEDDTKTLCKSLAHNGLEHKIVSISDYIKRQHFVYPTNDCVVFKGSTILASDMSCYVPGSYFTRENYNCSSYYNYFGKYLVNNIYHIVSFGELIRRKNEWFECYGPKIFIRPNCGVKIFAGTVIDSDGFDKFVKSCSLFPTDLVLVAGHKQISKEWRCYIVDREIVGCSQYMENGEIVIKRDNSHNLIDFAAEMSRIYVPDTCCVIDLALVNGRLELLELNSFSCCGLYDVDVDELVSRVNVTAVKEYNEFFMKEQD